MDKIINTIKNARHIAVMAHNSEDPDALGSCFAMYSVLRAMGKDAVCYLSEEIEYGMRFIGGEYVVYDGTNGGDYDLCICLDCGDKKLLGDRSAVFDKSQYTVCIDHHYTNMMFGDENYVDSKAAATGEVLYRLFVKMGAEITLEIARYLYIAISADTGGFKYTNTSPDTMRIAASLMECGIDHAELARLLFDTETLNEMRLKGELMSNIHSYCDGKLSIVCIDDEMFKRFGITDGVGTIVNIPRRVEGTEVAVCIKYKKGKMKISFRSNGKVNVAEIAAVFGGGGHIMAAGATIDTSDIADAEKRVVKACTEAIERHFTEQR